MTDDWECIAVMKKPRLRIDYPWHVLKEIEGDWTRLRFTASGLWTCVSDYLLPCDAAGYVGLPLAADQLLVGEAAPGTLLGKLGGSPFHRTDGTVFAIGKQCIVAYDKKPTIFSIAINGAPRRPTNELAELTLEICGIADPS